MSGTLRDLFDLPRDAGKTTFVVKLTDAVTHPELLLRDYAVTPGIAGALDHALDLVRLAVRDRTSSATYVHGSFGSGKSHFMAVVSLLLANHPAAWSVPEVHPLRPKHEWVASTKLLRLHLHMTGADSLEAQLFRAYLDAIRAAHPDAPVAPLFADHELFENAQSLRHDLGDARFFAKLNGDAPPSDGWGDQEDPSLWSAERFDRVRAGEDAAERAHLFDALVRSHFSSFTSQTGRWVEADRGFAVMSRHASALGYHGIVVFFDELILWLTSLASDRNRLSGEVQKLAKLVEAQDLRRPIPIVGFAARQRDIAEMVGHQFVGADAQLLTDTLKFWEGRFEMIRLEDKNLPAIVQKRVVRPRDEAAKQRLDQGFQELLRKLSAQDKGTLLGDQGDERALRALHPFSPALVEALVAMSAFLQRDRTALKLLLDLLLEHLDDYQFGRVVPVGDLYDALAGGEEPMDGAMRARWKDAKRLYQNELLPVIQTKHDTARAERCQRMRDSHRPELGCSNCREVACRADNRLLKTLLLAALVPEVAVLRGLSVSRLVQLNHGTLREAIPGTAGPQATARLRHYAGQVGKLRVGDELDPRVSLQLDGVDLKPILDGARTFDTQGARKAMLRELLFRALGVEHTEAPKVEYEVDWNGFRRKGVVYYGNVREMERGQFEVEPGYDFKVVIDFPFDEPSRTPQEDERKVIDLRDRGLVTTTAVWLPSFFSDRLQKDLAELVVIARVYEGRAKHLEHLRPEERAAAESELDSLLNQKRNRILAALDMAYGLRTPDGESLDPSRRVDRHVHTLLAESRATIPTETQLRPALTRVARELLEVRYPRHPTFDHEPVITRRRLDDALKRIQEVALADNQRVTFDKADAKLYEVGARMSFLNTHETTATVRFEKVLEVENRLRDKGFESPTVAQVRRAFDPEDLLGMTPELADFCVLAFAALQGRELYRDDRALAETPPLGRLHEDIVLLRPRLPESATWLKALTLAGAVLGVAREGLKTPSGRSLRQFAERCEARRKAAADAGADRIAAALARWEPLGATHGSARRETAESAVTLLRLLATRDAVDLVQALADFTPKTSDTALARHLAHASAALAVLEKDYFFHGLESLQGQGSPEAEALRAEVARALAEDELVVPLAPTIEAGATKAQKILGRAKKEQPVAAQPPEAFVAHVAQGSATSYEAARAELERLRAAIEAAGPNAHVTVSFVWSVK